MRENGKYIGANHTATGIVFGGIVSSFDQSFTTEEVLIEAGIGDIIPCVIGNIKNAYTLLEQEIKATNPKTIEQLTETVFKVVQAYFGDYSNISERMSFYPAIDDIETNDQIGQISSLQGKNSAMCVERAMLSQNLLKSLGITSHYKCSGIIKNNQNDIHAYNIISHNNKYYIYDATIPTQVDGKTTPLIAEIPEKIYQTIITPNARVGYSVETSHYNPLRNEDVHITYDAGRKDLYQTPELKKISK